MRRYAFGYLALLLVVALGAGTSLALGRRPRVALPTPQATSVQPRHTFHIDLAGWYDITPDETVLVSAYDLRMGSVHTALPLSLGDWHGEEHGTDADIERWFEHPDVVMRRSYQNGAGRILWITAIGSTGAKSFHLFEHTPHTCYPSANWATLVDDIISVTLPKGEMRVRRGVFGREELRMLVYYWYQWDSPDREAGRGVSTWRLTVDAPGGVPAAEEQALQFLRLLFYEQIPWHRF